VPSGHLCDEQVGMQHVDFSKSTADDADSFKVKVSGQLKLVQSGWQQFASVITVSSFFEGFNAEPFGQS
jgi:hypothetical protein